jgi:hypothetical protein
MKHKVRGWLKRYLPAEILSILVTLLCAWFAHKATGNMVTTALAGTWGGNVAYFGYILLSDVVQNLRVCKIQGIPYSTALFFNNLRDLFFEFGLAELIDSFLIRPALMFYFPIWFGNLTIGILVAKITADVTFYIPAIVSYELSKKYLKNSSNN